MVMARDSRRVRGFGPFWWWGALGPWPGVWVPVAAVRGAEWSWPGASRGLAGRGWRRGWRAAGARRLVGAREVVPRGERVRVAGLRPRPRAACAPRVCTASGACPGVGAQHPPAVGQGPLVQRDRLLQPTRRLIGVRE